MVAALGMRPFCAVCCLIATLSGVHARGADASRPHPHGGELARYQAQAPSAYGLSVDGVPLEKLRSGKPVLRMTTVAGGFKRSVSIQDVNAPPSVVWGRIMDLPKYPKMVEGCVECMPRSKARPGLYGRPAAQAADWPRLAEAHGSLAHDLAPREASGEPAGRRLCHLVFDAGASLTAPRRVRAARRWCTRGTRSARPA